MAYDLYINKAVFKNVKKKNFEMSRILQTRGERIAT